MGTRRLSKPHNLPCLRTCPGEPIRMAVAESERDKRFSFCYAVYDDRRLISMSDKDTTNGKGTVLTQTESNFMTMKPSIPVFYDILNSIFGANKRNGSHDMMRFNVMNSKREVFDPTEQRWREWTDADDSRIRYAIQANYGMYNKSMTEDALNIRFDRHKVNPLIDMLDSLQWDGKPRIELFLHNVMKAVDTPYTRECSRLIFAGGIHRAYDPGCQFDDMVVLIGDQGNGKSTIVRWLNMDDCFYREVKTIEGKEGIEALKGGWICEVAELLAVTKAKEAEAVKAYITCRSDDYRPPWGKNPVTLPRRCSFIGTTNKQLFLFDKTGNRRFYPVKCNLTPYDLHDHKEAIHAYILQAWAEAVSLYREKKLLPYARRELHEDILIAQENAMEDDWRVGAIQGYLEQHKNYNDSTVCVIELWYKALNQDDRSKPTRKDSIEIAQIVLSIPGWVRSDQPVYTDWGKQKVFKKVNKP